MTRKVKLTVLSTVHDAQSGERVSKVKVVDAVTEELIQEVEMDGQRAELLQRRGPFDLDTLHVGTETPEEVRFVPGTTAGEEETARVEAERAAAELAEQERLEAERLEAERVAAEEAALAAAASGSEGEVQTGTDPVVEGGEASGDASGDGSGNEGTQEA